MSMLQTARVLEPGGTEARERHHGSSEVISQVIEVALSSFASLVPQPQTVYCAPVTADESPPQLATYDQIRIGSLLDRRLLMHQPLTLQMEQEGEFHIATCEELNEFGYGTDPISAVQDARRTIAELYWRLKEKQDHLGPDLDKTWRSLSQLVYEA